MGTNRSPGRGCDLRSSEAGGVTPRLALGVTLLVLLALLGWTLASQIPQARASNCDAAWIGGGPELNNLTSPGWNDAGNWSDGAVPVPCTSVCIPAGATAFVEGDNGGPPSSISHAGTVSIASGGGLLVWRDSGNDSGDLRVTGAITNAGSIKGLCGIDVGGSGSGV